MPKRYASRKRTYRKKSRKITRFRRYRTGTRAKAKSYFRLRRAAKNYSKTKKIRRAKRQYKYTAGKGVKNKLKHLTLSDFASLPFYDLVRLTSMVMSGSSPNMYDNVTAEVRSDFNTQAAKYWTRYGAILPESCFNTTTPYVPSVNTAYPPCLFAFNPILSPVTCGSKMQLYAALYKKFKYVGIKVTWHPRSQKITQIIPTQQEVTPGSRPDGSKYQDTYNAYAVNDQNLTIPSTLTNPAAVGVMLNPGTMKHIVDVSELTTYSTQQLYMHVYFGKQIQNVQYWSMPFLEKTGEGANHHTAYETSHDITTDHRDRRMKAAPFYDFDTMLPCIERDSKLHKVYDMSRPFSFFVRPMVASDDSTKEAPTNAAHAFAELEEPAPEAFETLQKGLKHLGYKEFNHALVPDQLEIPQDTYGVAHAHDPNDKYYQRWSILNNDDNFFNPIMFWYCFTTSDDYNPSVDQYKNRYGSHQLFSSYNSSNVMGNNSNAKRELGSKLNTENSYLNSFGYFDVTFYTKWKEERPLVSKTSYVGIVPSETGVTGLSSIIGPNN